MVAVEIENPHLNDDAGEEIRTEIGRGGYRQSSVTSTGDRDFLRASVTLFDHPFRTPTKVEEGVAFLLLVASLVPGLAVLASPADVGHDEDAVEVMNPEESSDGEERFHRNGETSVGVEMRGILSVLLQILPMNDEHGDLSGLRRVQALRVDEDLFGDEVGEIESLEFDAFEDRQGRVEGGRKITTVDRRGREKRFQTNEDLRLALISPRADVPDR